MCLLGGGRGVPRSVFYVAWPAEEFLCQNKHKVCFCSDGGIGDVRASCRDCVKESMGDRALQAYVNRPTRCDEPSSWRSMNSKFDSCGKSLLCATVRLGQGYMQGRPSQNWRHGTTLMRVTRTVKGRDSGPQNAGCAGPIARPRRLNMLEPPPIDS